MHYTLQRPARSLGCRAARHFTLSRCQPASPACSRTLHCRTGSAAGLAASVLPHCSAGSAGRRCVVIPGSSALHFEGNMGACSKVTLTILCLIMSIPALSFGVYAAVTFKGATMPGETIGFVVACFVVAFIPVIGIWGAFAESRCLLITFIVMTFFGLLLFALFGGLSIAAWNSKEAYQNVLKSTSDEKLKELVKPWLDKDECCGCEYKPDILPPCKSNGTKPDCCHELEKEFRKTGLIFGAVGLTLAVIQLACIVMAFIICHGIARQPQEPVALGMPPGQHGKTAKPAGGGHTHLPR